MRALKPDLKPQYMGEILSFGNGGGMLVARTRTDRLRARKIPLDVWTQLSSDAKHLLRYAHVIGERSEVYKRDRSLTQSAILLKEMAEAAIIYSRLRTSQILGLRRR